MAGGALRFLRHQVASVGPPRDLLSASSILGHTLEVFDALCRRVCFGSERGRRVMLEKAPREIWEARVCEAAPESSAFQPCCAGLSRGVVCQQLREFRNSSVKAVAGPCRNRVRGHRFTRICNPCRLSEGMRGSRRTLGRGQADLRPGTSPGRSLGVTMPRPRIRAFTWGGSRAN